MISETAKYNESIGEWTIRGIAFAGNNVHEVNKNLPKRIDDIQMCNTHFNLFAEKFW
jgi:hypothetical protein